MCYGYRVISITGGACRLRQAMVRAVLDKDDVNIHFFILLSHAPRLVSSLVCLFVYVSVYFLSVLCVAAATTKRS